MIEHRYIDLKHELFDIYYEKLNDMQRESVYSVNGPNLILAGAGSGKTTVLVNRITHIIRYGNGYAVNFIPDDLTEETIAEMEQAKSLPHDELGKFLERFSYDAPSPWSVMAITFTNKAANEIKARLSAAFGEGSEAAYEVWAGTFHSICMRLLRRYGEAVGYTSDAGICDTDDAKKLITDCMKKLNIDTKQLPVKSVMSAISRAKDNLMTAADFSKETGNDFKLKQIARIYEMYSARLLESNLLDFDDIIMQTVFMLRFNDEIWRKLQNRFRYVLVDEFQDTNVAQLELTMLLSGGYDNIMVVGDDDQSIYKFRGATIENILSFDRKYENVTVIRLEQNYRSTKNILDAANAVIKKNEGRHAKNLWCDGARGDEISLVRLQNQLDEAKYICDTITDAVSSGRYSYRDFAILYRMNSQSRTLEQAMAKGGVPYRLLGGTRFFDRAEIRDMVAYLCVINNPSDSIHLRRIANVPKRGIGERSLENAEMLASSLGISMLELMRNASHYEALPTAAAHSMEEFAKMIADFRVMADEGNISELIRRVYEDTGYEKMLEAAGEAEADRIDNVGELVSTAVQYEENADEPSLSEFLLDVALVSDVDKYDESADAVVLMTIHSAKGLEFPVVFLPGLEEGIFPGYQSIFNPEDIEEERRLCYVAITRAKEKLYLLNVHERMLNGSTQYNKVSRFVEEIPPELIDEQDKTGRSGRIMSFGDEKEMHSLKVRQNRNSPLGTSPARINAEKNLGIIKKENKPKPSAFAVGNRVRHVTFGPGTVLSVKPMGGDIMYEIDFDKVGTKKLMATFARLTAE